ncbi:MAG: DpnI domain-containing protein, partial [Thermoplasmata archaeon]
MRCGSPLIPYPPNTPVYDFYCNHPKKEPILLTKTEKDNFQLKSTKSYPHGNFPSHITGAEYNTTMKSLMNGNFPSIILLHYDRSILEIEDV